MVERLSAGWKHPFDPSPDLARFREEEPLHRLGFADGHVGWVVTSHALARTVLAEGRFSARAELVHPAVEHADEPVGPEPAPPGVFLFMDPPDHTRYRRLLASQFTVRRMKQFEPRVSQIVADHLDAMEVSGPPADLVEAFGWPVPSVVICELLGVTPRDRDVIERYIRDFRQAGRSRAETLALKCTREELFGDLIARKRVEDADDVLTGLIRSGGLTDDELIGIAFLVIGAAHMTTSLMLTLGTWALLSHPSELDAVRTGRVSMNGVVEELLRYLTIFRVGTTRTALKDIALDGQVIKAGECVMIALAAANRDPAKFAGQPENLDVARDARSHVAFGHGIHQCLGQQLARVQMRIGYSQLLNRFPAIRLAVPPDEVPLGDNQKFDLVKWLPIEW